MIAVVRAAGSDSTRWHLVRRTGVSADVLAHAVAPLPASPGDRCGQPWLPAVRKLRDGDGVMTVAATGDGHFRWTLTGAHDAMVAESPGVYRDAEACRESFRAAQDAARLALGGRQHHDLLRVP
ncbi:hypothetical protein [Actinoplanes sp. NPDC049681]|uniref:hypothetical protein n=1 Tax=Actinoplanes sp. NPDC049681 TaxID=3363905 RepID=UPI0037B3BE14